MTAANMSMMTVALVIATMCLLSTMGEEEKKRTLDSLSGSDFFKKSLDSLSGNDFFKREDEKRTLDSLSGSDFFKKKALIHSRAMTFSSVEKKNVHWIHFLALISSKRA